MIKMNRVFMSRVLVIALLPLGSQMAWAGSRNTDVMIGGALGGVIGSVLGSQMGGRDGAVVGAGLGAMAGVALTANNGYHQDRYEHARYVDEHCRDDYRGGHRENYRESYREHDGGDRGYYADRGEGGWHGEHEDYRPRHYRD